MKVEVLGAHNTETDKARLPCLLIDDLIALDAGGLTSSLSLERQQMVKAVLLTHHHFDHTRDLVMLGANYSEPPSTVEVYGLQDTLDTVYRYLLDGKMYKDFTVWPSAKNPRLRLNPIVALQVFSVLEHAITAVPVSHSAPAVGFQVVSNGGRSIFYVGDAGPGLAECWQRVRPEVLFIEVTGPNRMTDTMLNLRHLTPQLLLDELRQFHEMRGYLPRVVATHIPVLREKEIKSELSLVGKELGTKLEIAYEGLKLEV
jgi:cAMP phosphodiesterase